MKMKWAAPILIGLLTWITYPTAFADSSATQNTIRYYISIEKNPARLFQFLKQMPKGGDLHVHADGAANPQELISFAQQENYCIDPKTFAVMPLGKPCDNADLFKNITYNSTFYNHIVDAWSLRDFPVTTQQAGPHFFGTFPKFMPLVYANLERVIANIVNRAGIQ